MGLTAAIIAIPSSAIMLFFATATIFLYLSYVNCLYLAFKTGSPRKCYWLGWFILVIMALISLVVLFIPETFKTVVIDAEKPSAADLPRVAAIGDLGMPESFTPISGLGQSHRLADANES